MRFGFNYGMGAGSSRYRNSFLVSYLMDTVYTDGAMDRFLDNVGSNGSNNDAVANASNFIYLDNQSVNYPVLHDFGADGYTSIDTTGARVTETVITDGYNIVSIGGGTDSGEAIGFAHGSIDAGKVVVIGFDCVINSGTAIFDGYYDGTDYVDNPKGSFTIVNGYNEIVVPTRNVATTRTTISKELPAQVAYDIDITNITVKEITLPTASYLTILQADGTIKQLSSTGDVGENLVSNGDFSDGTVDGWGNLNNATISNENEMLKLQQTSTTLDARTAIGTAVTTGRRYFASMTHFDGTGYTENVRMGSALNFVDYLHSYNKADGFEHTALFDSISYEFWLTLYLYDDGVNLNNIYFDDAILREALPVSTTYSETASHQFVFNHTSPLTAADVSAIEADPNLVFRMFFDGEVLPSGFSNTDVDWFSGGNEGLASGAYVQDLSTALGAEKVINGEFTSDVIGWTPQGGCVVTYDNGRAKLSDGVGLAPNSYIENSVAMTLTNGSMYRLIIDVELGGYAYADVYDEVAAEYIIPLRSITSDGTYIAYFIAAGNSVFRFYLRDGDDGLTGGWLDNITIKEASTVEIQAYDTATRTTLANQSKGASNLKLIQDGSGRTTGIAVANTTQWKADGRTAITNWTITAPFTITEEIDGDAYDFTSDGNRYKNTVADGTYTLPTGVWTLDEFGFDGVTPVTVRGKTSVIDAVVIP